MSVPYLPLYTADYLADTSHLTTLEHGAYMLLIMNYWQRGKALPADDRKLARIAGLGPREWKRVKATICEFFEVSCDTWFHTRLESELHKLRDKSLKKQKGGLARAQQMQSERSARGQLYIGVGKGIPLSKDNGAAPDPDKVFWDNAKAYLGPKNASLIGKWCKDYGQEETAKAITAAQLARAVDQVPYIVETLKKTKQPAQLDWGPC